MPQLPILRLIPYSPPSAATIPSSSEVESEQTAAHRSVSDVLEGFAALFGQDPFQPPHPAATASPAAAAGPAAAVAGPNPAAAKCSSKDASVGLGQQAQQPAGHQPANQQEEQEPGQQQDLGQILADVRRRVAGGQLLGAQPLAAMRLLLAGVHPLQLQRDVEQQLPPAEAAAAATACAAGAAAEAVCVVGPAAGEDGSEVAAAVRPGNQAELEKQLQAAAGPGSLAAPPFSLVSPKLAALAGQLMQCRLAAAAATAAAAAQAAEGCGEGQAAAGGANGSASPGWCGIIFVSQRMAAWALHKLLRCGTEGKSPAWRVLLSPGYLLPPAPHSYPLLAFEPRPTFPRTHNPNNTSHCLQHSALHPRSAAHQRHHGAGLRHGRRRLWLPGKGGALKQDCITACSAQGLRPQGLTLQAPQS